MGKGCKVLFTDCDPTQAQDRELPNNSYLIEYLQDGMTKFDIAMGAKQVDIFDDYYDKYQKDFVTMNQTEGRLILRCMGISQKKIRRKRNERRGP